MRNTIFYLLLLLPTQWCHAQTACTTVNSERVTTFGTVLTGRIDLKNPTCIEADSITLKSDLLLLTNGNEVEIRARDLVVEDGARIWAFDYPQEAQIALARVPPNSYYFFPITYDPGPNTQGFAGGRGRNGGDAHGMSPIGNGRPGDAGKSPLPIRISATKSAIGLLSIVARGTSGLAGQDGLWAHRAGDGEQGLIGQRDSIGLCATGPNAGGNGGRGGFGGTAGVGGEAGSGGMLVIDVPVGSAMTVVADVAAGVLWSNLPGHLDRWKIHHLRSNTWQGNARHSTPA